MLEVQQVCQNRTWTQKDAHLRFCDQLDPCRVHYCNIELVHWPKILVDRNYWSNHLVVDYDILLRFGIWHALGCHHLLD